MDYLITNLLANIPTGLWEKIILSFNSAFASFALSIIMLTICIKLVMLPIDFFNRRTNLKTATMQQKLQPALDAINKSIKDPSVRNQKIAELYKREKFSPMGSCFTMLINLALTLTIFITLLSGLNNMAAYKIQTQYEQLQIAYVTDYVSTTHSIDILEVIAQNDALDNSDESKKSVYEICLPYINELSTASDEIKATANSAVENRYKEVRESFLWIDNIWLADTPFVNSIPSYEDYAKVARLSQEQISSEEMKVSYNQIMDELRSTSSRANGYFGLVILCGATAFLNQWLMTKKSKKSAQASQQQVGSGKVMLIVMPVLMAVFTLIYTSMFSLYIITSQIVSIATLPLINLINKKIEERKQKNIPDNRMKRIGG